MLDNTDKKWIAETIDEKLDGTKTELGEEMQRMKTDIAEEVSRHVMVVFKNTYQQYMQVIGGNIPDLMRSFNNIREQQERHQASIELLNNIVKDLDHRVTVLEHSAG